MIDKPGKGAFYATDLDALLRNFGIQHLLVCGVTTEVCVNTTVREANDRGYRCVVLSDCCASYFPEFHEMGLAMIKAQGAIFGWVADSAAALAAMQAAGAEACERVARVSLTDWARGHVMAMTATTHPSRQSGRRATGTPSSASAPTFSSTCWCSPACCASC